MKSDLDTFLAWCQLRQKHIMRHPRKADAYNRFYEIELIKGYAVMAAVKESE